MSKYGVEVAQIKSENEADVRYIIKNFKNDAFTDERLKKVLENEKEYVIRESKKRFACRASRNVIVAIDQMLSNPELI